MLLYRLRQEQQQLFRYFLLLFPTCTEVGADLRYEIVRNVIDGDTIVLQSGERVRLAGINTPELNRDKQLSERYLRRYCYADWRRLTCRT